MREPMLYLDPVAPDIDKLISKLQVLCERHHLNPLFIPFAIAMDEIVSNIVSYGLHIDLIGLRLRCVDGGIEAEIIDDGMPFNPVQRPDPDIHASVADRDVGGLGIFIVRNLMDSMRYQRQGTINRLRLFKRAPA